MSDTQQAMQDASGVTRTADGTIADQSSPSSGTTQTSTGTEVSQQTTTQAQTTTQNDNTSLLNQDDKTKTEGDKPADKADAKGKDSKVVPDTYADFKLPEGFELDGEVKTNALKMFKDWGLTQDQAQSAIDFYTKSSQEAAEAPMNFYLDTRKGWQDEVKASPDLGPKLSEVKTTIGRAIATLPENVGQAFREAMDITGAGDHPAFVRAFYHLAQKVTEGRPVPGRGPSPNGQTTTGTTRPPTTAEAMYPNLPSANR